MSGIIGAINGSSVVSHLIAGLRRLEHHGYDSTGITVARASSLDQRRALGPLDNLESLLREAPLDGHSGIAHTRWATRGAPPSAHAHPDGVAQVAVVHTGTICNLDELRAELSAEGHTFERQTATEVITRLITHHLESGAAPEEAARRAIARLEGRYALGILFPGDDEQVIAARHGSPLLLGHADGAMFLASDALALSGCSEALTHLEDGDWALLDRYRATIHDRRGRCVQRPRRRIDPGRLRIDMAGYPHHTLKEIHEQPDAIRRTLLSIYDLRRSRIQLPGLPFEFADLPRLNVIACGSSYYAGLIAKYWFEQLAGLPVDVHIASEFRYRQAPLQPGGAALFISQSGETADTLAAMRYAREQQQHLLSLVNVADSSLARSADLVLLTRAGPEIGVASTKAFTAQLALLAGIAIQAARARGRLDDRSEERLTNALIALPHHLEQFLAYDSAIERTAHHVADASSALLIGRGTAYPIALEGAMKLKEIAYIHAEGYCAGELKHGPLALIDDRVPVFVLAPRDALFDRTISNMQEVTARGGRVILISDEAGVDRHRDEVEATIAVPHTLPLLQPILYALPMQLLAYHIAARKGHNVDRPRNLAKSVTVE